MECRECGYPANHPLHFSTHQAFHSFHGIDQPAPPETVQAFGADGEPIIYPAPETKTPLTPAEPQTPGAKEANRSTK